jgi:hypothetical protein
MSHHTCVTGSRQRRGVAWTGTSFETMGTHCFYSGALNSAVRLLTLISVWLAVGAFAAPIPPVERLLPDDTLALITAPDFAKLRELLRQTPMSQLWRDPAMKPFREKFLDKWEQEFAKPLERDLNIRFADYTSLPQGQFTLALTQNGWDGQSEVAPAFLLLLDAGVKANQLKRNLSDVRKKWVDAGKTLRTEKIRDVEFAILTLSSNDVPKTLRRFTDGPPREMPQVEDDSAVKPAETKRELAVGQIESLLILGTSTKTIEKVVARLTGGSVPALGDIPAFEADRLAQFRDAPFYGWVNAKLLMDVLNKLPAPKPVPDQPPPLGLKTMLAATGLSGLKTLALSFRATGDGSILQFTLGAPEPARTGLTKILAPEAKDAAPPAFVPADAAKFQRLRIDGQKAWAALEKMANDISPAWANVLNMFLQTADKAGKERDAGFDARKDIIGNLGDELITWEKLPRGDKLDTLDNAPSLTLIGSPNSERLVVSVGSLLAAIPQAGPPRQREFLGRKIFTATPPMFGPPDDPQGNLPSIHYAAGGGYLGFSQDAALLEEWLRSADSPPKPLREVAGLTDAIQKAGGSGKGWMGYENQAEVMRFVFEAFKRDLGAANNALLSGPLNAGVNFATDGKGLLEWFDFSLLPAWDAVAKYFYFTVNTGSADADGVTYRYFSPTPPGLKK